MTDDPIAAIDSWSAWHAQYDDGTSELNARKTAVQAQVAALVERSPRGPVTVVSICGGQGREVIGAIETHPRRADVRGRIIEMDADNAAFARRWVERAGLAALEVAKGDAAAPAAYADLPPVDIAVVSGVFGHLSEPDRAALIAFLASLVRQGGYVVWTFFDDSEATTRLRDAFQQASFEQEAFEKLPGRYGFVVACSRLAAAPRPFESTGSIFTFGSSR